MSMKYFRIESKKGYVIWGRKYDSIDVCSQNSIKQIVTIMDIGDEIKITRLPLTKRGGGKK